VFDEIVRSLVLLVEDTVLALHPVEIVVKRRVGRSVDRSRDASGAGADGASHERRRARLHRLWRKRKRSRGCRDAQLVSGGRSRHRRIRDNGRGLRDDFSLDVPTSLGLSIVRDLIRTQLYGEIEMKSVAAVDGGGTFVRVAVPLSARP